jgi:hypothetical protein
LRFLPSPGSPDCSLSAGAPPERSGDRLRFLLSPGSPDCSLSTGESAFANSYRTTQRRYSPRCPREDKIGERARRQQRRDFNLSSFDQRAGGRESGGGAGAAAVWRVDTRRQFGAGDDCGVGAAGRVLFFVGRRQRPVETVRAMWARSDCGGGGDGVGSDTSRIRKFDDREPSWRAEAAVLEVVEIVVVVVRERGVGDDDTRAGIVESESGKAAPREVVEIESRTGVQAAFRDVVVVAHLYWEIERADDVVVCV